MYNPGDGVGRHRNITKMVINGMLGMRAMCTYLFRLAEQAIYKLGYLGKFLNFSVPQFHYLKLLLLLSHFSHVRLCVTP